MPEDRIDRLKSLCREIGGDSWLGHAALALCNEIDSLDSGWCKVLEVIGLLVRHGVSVARRPAGGLDAALCRIQNGEIAPWLPRVCEVIGWLPESVAVDVVLSSIDEAEAIEASVRLGTKPSEDICLWRDDLESRRVAFRLSRCISEGFAGGLARFEQTLAKGDRVFMGKTGLAPDGVPRLEGAGPVWWGASVELR